MSRCMQCGSENPDSANYCKNCGSELKNGGSSSEHTRDHSGKVEGWNTFRGNPGRTGALLEANPVTDPANLKWDIQVARAEIPYHGIVASEGVVYVSRSDGLSVLDGDTGDQVWKYTLEVPKYGLSVSDGKVFLGTDTGLVVLDAETSDHLWSKDIDFSQIRPAFAVGSEGVFATTVDGVLALRLDGSEFWKYSIAQNFDYNRDLLALWISLGNEYISFTVGSGNPPRGLSTKLIVLEKKSGKEIGREGSGSELVVGKKPVIFKDYIYNRWDLPFFDTYIIKKYNPSPSGLSRSEAWDATNTSLYTVPILSSSRVIDLTENKEILCKSTKDSFIWKKSFKLNFTNDEAENYFENDIVSTHGRHGRGIEKIDLPMGLIGDVFYVSGGKSGLYGFSKEDGKKVFEYDGLDEVRAIAYSQGTIFVASKTSVHALRGGTQVY